MQQSRHQVRVRWRPGREQDAGRPLPTGSGQEKVKDGVKVAIKDRPEAEEVIPTKALDEPIGKAAFAYADR
jgi:hypothetical protein